MVKHVESYKEFQEVVSKGTVLVDFYAVWCGPCKMLAPVVLELSENTPDVTFVKVDVDEIEELADEFSITSIPTLLLFKDGKLVKRDLGYKSYEQLDAFVKSVK